jgi:hypothetical protein
VELQPLGSRCDHGGAKASRMLCQFTASQASRFSEVPSFTVKRGMNQVCSDPNTVFEYSSVNLNVQRTADAGILFEHGT